MVVGSGGNVFQFTKRKAIEAVAEEKRTQMFLDNKCLGRRGALEKKSGLHDL